MRTEIPQTSLGKGLAVLAALADLGPMRVDALAERTGLPASTVYRYLRELVAFGFVEPQDGVYVAGERLAQMARTNGWSDQLTQFSASILADLSAASGETAILTVRVGRSALVVDRVESNHAIRLSFQRGGLRPLHAGASAKVLLAYAPQPLRDEVLASMPDSVRQRLNNQLVELRQRGYTITHGEVDPYAVGIAVPIFRGDRCVCGLSIAGPNYRIDTTRITELCELLRAAGDRLSETLTEAAAM